MPIFVAKWQAAMFFSCRLSRIQSPIVCMLVGILFTLFWPCQSGVGFGANLALCDTQQGYCPL